MVKTPGKQSAEDKKESKKKSSSSSASSSAKKKPDTGSWPCKMDGCKKVFAREADLKRHQRTTKTHSIPGFQCPQCDATFTRTDALRRHQKSRHNGVVIEPEVDKSKGSADGSVGSRSPSPSGTPARSHGEGSMNGSPPAAGSAAGSTGRASSYYRPHTMQDGYYATYPPAPRPPPPGMMIDPHYPPQPMGLPTSATRGNWQPSPSAPPPLWGPGPEGHPMAPPPGMYIPSYYPGPYYRHPGMPGLPPHMSQINPELLAQSNGQPNGVGPPESALRNTSAESPKAGGDKHSRDSARPSYSSYSQPHAPSTSASTPSSASQRERHVEPPEPSSPDQIHSETGDGTDAANALMAAAALQAVLAYQKEQEDRDSAASASANADASRTASTQPDSHSEPPATDSAASEAEPGLEEAVVERSGSTDVSQSQPQVASRSQPQSQTQRIPVEQPPDTGPAVVPVQGGQAGDIDDDVDAVGEPDQEMSVDDIVDVHAGQAEDESLSRQQLVAEDGTPMLNPEELLTQESLASPPPS